MRTQQPPGRSVAWRSYHHHRPIVKLAQFVGTALVLGLITISLAACDASTGGVDDTCNYVVLGIWGQSNAVRVGADTTYNPSEDPLSVAYSLSGGRTNVLRWNSNADTTFVRDEISDGSIIDPLQKQELAYVDLANRLYESRRSCVVYAASAVGGSGLQHDTYPDDPARVWDPRDGELFSSALGKLAAAYSTSRTIQGSGEVAVLIYWNQGIRDARIAAEQAAAYRNGGPAPTVTVQGWKDGFIRLANTARSQLEGSFPGADLRIALSLSARDARNPDNVFIDSLLTAQREVADLLDFVYVVSEVMPDETTYPHYADCTVHLSWRQYRYCENAAVADGIAHILDGDTGWSPLDIDCSDQQGGLTCS